VPLDEWLDADASYVLWVAIAGGFTAFIVVLGGMRGTSYNQAFQGIIIFGAMVLLLVLAVIAYFNYNPFEILGEADNVVTPAQVVEAGVADQLIEPYNDGTAESSIVAAEASSELLPEEASALTPGTEVKDLLNQMSLVLGLFLGVVGLPHVLIRLYTVKDAVAARKSTELTIVSLAIFYIMTLFVGLAAMVLLYPQLLELLAADQAGAAKNNAVPLLGELLGGQWLLGVVLAGAMAAILSSAVGLLIQMTTTVAHDGYTVLLRPESSEQQRVTVARVAGIVLTILAVGMAIWLKDENVAQLVAMTFGIAASTFAPILLLTVWWTRLTRQGVIAGFIVGLVVSLVFTLAKYSGVEDIFGVPVLVNPALYGVPTAFLAAILVSLGTKDVGAVDHFMRIAHDRDGSDSRGGQPSDAS
jgi:cation/acetate symporter